MHRKEWAAEEDKYIIECVLRHGPRWRQIASALPGRTDDAVRNRWNRLQEQMDGEESNLSEAANDPLGLDSCFQPLMAEVGNVGEKRRIHGVSDDSRIPDYRQFGRSSNHTAERTQWTDVEDALITAGVGELGHKWNMIAERLPGRTDHAIRNRWSRLQMMQKWPGGNDLLVSSIARPPSDQRPSVAPTGG